MTVSINDCSRDSVSYILCKKSARPQWWAWKSLEHEVPTWSLETSIFFVCYWFNFYLSFVQPLKHIIFDFVVNSVKGVVNKANEKNEYLINCNMSHGLLIQITTLMPFL